jgi:excisionase family DNA binding protein
MKPTSEIGNVIPFRVAVSVNEFCRAYGISRTLFYRLKMEGKIRFIKVGRRTLIPLEEVNAWLAQDGIGTADSYQVS